MHIKKGFKICLIFILCFFALAVYKISRPSKLDSANLSSVKNTLSSSRLSFVGAVGSGSTAGSSILEIKTDDLPDWATSDNNQNLFSDDTLRVGDNGNDYTVIDIIDDASENKIQLDSGLAAGDADVDEPVIATRSAQHTVSFTPVSQVDDGYFRVRIKATDGTTAQSQDGIPDSDGFDFTDSFLADYIDCSNAEDGTASIEYSDEDNCPAGYTCVYCSYSGNNDTSAKSIEIGTTDADQQPINPSPSSEDATEGAAGTDGGYDTYDFYVDHLDSSYETVDSTQGKIAVVESVRVTAVVEPSIEFQISGVDSGTSVCGVSTDVSTTATAVPFGAVTISDFIDAAQELGVATNASGGYAVTTFESDELNLITATGLDTTTYIPDTTCDGGACDESTSGDWNDADNANGFGYSLDDDDSDVDTTLFQYDDETNFAARQFPNDAGGESAVEIMASNSETATQDCYVCYRTTVSSTQSAGTYENSVTYVATATF